MRQRDARPSAGLSKNESPGLCDFTRAPKSDRQHWSVCPGGERAIGKCSVLRFGGACRVRRSGTPVSPAGYSLPSEPVHIHDQCNRHGDPIRECQGRNGIADHTPRERVGDGVAEFDGIANVRRRHSGFSSAGCGRGTAS